MIGMDAKTGKAISGDEHLRQSVTDILKTSLNTRLVMRPYGSRLFNLVDRPMNDATKVEVIAAVSEALLEWEPRIDLKRVIPARSGEWRLSVSIEYRNKETGEPGQLGGITV